MSELREKINEFVASKSEQRMHAIVPAVHHVVAADNNATQATNTGDFEEQIAALRRELYVFICFVTCRFVMLILSIIYVCLGIWVFGYAW